MVRRVELGNFAFLDFQIGELHLDLVQALHHTLGFDGDIHGGVAVAEGVERVFRRFQLLADFRQLLLDEREAGARHLRVVFLVLIHVEVDHGVERLLGSLGVRIIQAHAHDVGFLAVLLHAQVF